MVKVIFECEVCGRRSNVLKDIDACEAIVADPVDVKPGDVVCFGGSGYGWWEGSEEWFHREPGDPKSPSHHVRATIGHPKFIVLDLVPRAKVSRNSLGDFAHQLVAVIYSPDHANYPNREAFGWNEARSLRKLGEVSPEELERYRAVTRHREECLLLS